MKKRITTVALATMLLGFSSSMVAQEYYDAAKTMDVYKTNEVITIDGEANEAIWSAPGVTEQTAERFGQDDYTNTTGCSYKFKAVWDDDYLYIFIKAVDNTWIPYDKTLMKGDTNVDNIEFYFSPLNRVTSEDGTIGSFDLKEDSQVRASVGSTTSWSTGRGLFMTFAIDNAISGYEYVTKQTADGYTMEVQIPWEVVISEKYYDEKVAEGQTILFDLAAADCITYDSGRTVIQQWSCNDWQNWKRNAKYGEITLKGASSTGLDNQIADVKYTFANGELSLANVQPNAEVAVYDLSGRMVETVNYNGTAINLSHLISGVYMVQVENAGNFKIVK